MTQNKVISRCCFAGAAQKCTKIYNARAQLLFRSLNLLCSDVLVAVVVVVCLNSQMLKVITSNSASNLICHVSTVHIDSSTTTISMSGSTCSDVNKFYSFSDRRRSNDEQMNFRRDVAAIQVSLIKNEGIECPSEVLNRTTEEVSKVLFCGRGLKFVSHVSVTNSYKTHYLLSAQYTKRTVPQRIQLWTF